MYLCKTNTEDNYLYLYFDGFFSGEEMKKAVDDSLLQAEKLEKEYVIINNISKLHMTDLQALKEFKRIMRQAEADKVTKVIRIIGENLAKVQLEDISYDITYKIMEVKTESEAFKLIGKTQI